MRENFSGNLRFNRSKNNRSYTIDLTTNPGVTMTYTDEGIPQPPELDGVAWILSFLVDGPGPTYTLSITGDLPPGKTEFVVYCLEGGRWINRPRSPQGRWVLPPGDPAVGIR